MSISRRTGRWRFRGVLEVRPLTDAGRDTQEYIGTMSDETERRMFRSAVSSAGASVNVPDPDVARRVFEIGSSLQEHLLSAARLGADLDVALLELSARGSSVESVAHEAHVDVALVQHVFGGHHSLDYLLRRMTESSG
jgi:hypothetical protein